MLFPLPLANPRRGARLSLEEEVVGGGAALRGERSARRVSGGLWGSLRRYGARGSESCTPSKAAGAVGTAEAGVLAVGRKVVSEAGARGQQRPALGAVARRDRSGTPRRRDSRGHGGGLGDVG